MTLVIITVILMIEKRYNLCDLGIYRGKESGQYNYLANIYNFSFQFVMPSNVRMEVCGIMTIVLVSALQTFMVLSVKVSIHGF